MFSHKVFGGRAAQRSRSAAGWAAAAVGALIVIGACSSGTSGGSTATTITGSSPGSVTSTTASSAVTPSATGSSAGPASSSSAPGGQSSASSTPVTGKDAAAAAVAAAMKLPEFKSNPPFDMGSTKGKRVTVVLSTSAVPFVANIGKGIQQAGGVVGWSVTVMDGKGSVTEWSRLVQQAVSQKVDGIITVGASPAQFKPAVAAAKQAGIPVVDTLTADQEKDPLVPGTFSHVSISFYDSGRLQADYVIANGTPDSHVLVFGDNEFPGEVTRVAGMKDEFAKLCPGCTVTVQDTQVGSLATQMASTTQNLLRRDPQIQWVLPTYDGQATYIIPAIKSAGLAGKVKVVGSDAVAANLGSVAKNDVQVADVGEPAGWSGWAAVDMLGRALTGGQPVPPNIPLRMFTSQNLAGLNVNDEDQLFGSSFQAGYKAQWGIG